MKLIVGLGNVGKEYNNTRHNTGFMAIDEILSYLGISLDRKKFNGSYVIYKDKNLNEEIIFLKPESYMNLSGEVVKRFVEYYKIDINDILVISDDLDLPLGKIKIKYKGSSGGHNGLKNIEYHLGTKEYKRIKIGISNDKKIDTKDYVLGKFSAEQFESLKKVLSMFPDIFIDYLNNSFDNLMSKYNKN